MSGRSLTCDACGRANDVTAFACSSCGASLIGAGASDRWVEARERDMAIERDAERRRDRRSSVGRTLVVALAFVLAIGLIYVGGSWFLRNYYVGGEPSYEGHPPAYWSDMMLTSQDQYLRRRGAQTLDAMSDGFNERTAREVAPALSRALNDPDETVRQHAKSALDKIGRNTGVTAPGR